MPEDWLILAEAYILGEEFLDHAFKDAIADLMVYIATRRPVASRSALRDSMPMDRVVQIIFDGTPETSPLRVLIIDIFKWHGQELLRKCGEALPQQFTRSLADALFKPYEGINSKLEKNACTYHSHAQDEKCPSTTERDWKAWFAGRSGP